MDDIDRKLLDQIQRDGRQSYAQYGEAVGLSAAATHDRLKKLFHAEAVKHWSAVIDPEAAGLPVLAFIRVQVDLPANAQGLADAMVVQPEVLECHHTSGEWHCLLKVRAASDAHLDTLIAEAIATRPGVSRLQTDRITASAKESHVLAPVALSR